MAATAELQTTSNGEYVETTLIKQALDEGLVSPEEIASWVDERLTDEDRLDFARRRLKEHVRYWLGSRRRANGRTNGSGSAKWEAASSVLENRVCVAGQWKLLATCSAQDLIELAKQHRDIAKFNLQEAQGYERLAKVLSKRKANLVGDLSEEVVREALDG